ncbi:hypothetical protein [Blastomonas sp.]|uniref:hypothetical protein n=1 Tax=Blastomonas sp. TaxID=1909299 RepID=UPI00263882D1|nr:hypothetical protein [Blastomonas sp.]MDM7956791.1 hypothetical protein [Blastomonas sp.]
MTQENHSAPREPAAHDPDANGRKQHIKTLFTRYPAISNDERRELTTYLKTGPLLEIGLLKGDETIRYKIAAFEQEQQKALDYSPVSIIVLLVIFVLLALVLTALWDMGS